MRGNNQNKLTFIDLFSGCGGLSEGFMKSGKYIGLAHVEWELPMVKTLRNRLEKKWGYSKDDSLKKVIHFDIQKTSELINGEWSEKSISDYSKSNHYETINYGLKGLIKDQKIDLIIGGPPCQAYSIAGRAQDKNSMKDDYRNYLFESFVKVVEKFKPTAFLFENVPGLLSAIPGDIPVTERIYNAFSKINYIIRDSENLKKSIFSASDFGVPQNRKRVILIGVRRDSKIDLEDLYAEIDKSRKIKLKLTVKDAIGHLPPIMPIKSFSNIDAKKVSHQVNKNIEIPFHEPRFHNKRDIKLFKKWIIEEMNNRSTKEKIDFYNRIIGKNSRHTKYRNLEWDKQSPTIVAHLNKDGLMFIHPDSNQARSITVKEAALLQSFPDDFEFMGAQGIAYKMIGNAVPPEMAKNIAISIYKKLNNK